MSAAELRKAAEALREGAEVKNSPYMVPPLWAMAMADWLEEHADDHTSSRHECRWVTCSGETVARIINGGA